MNPKRYPDRAWFWSVLATVLPHWANEYKRLVVNSRRDKKTIPPNQTKLIKISDKWLARLQAHDYTTNSKSIALP